MRETNKDILSIDDLINKIKHNSYSDCERIVLGEVIEFNIREDCIDVYKYRDEEDIDEDYKSEEDYITTIYF